MLRIFTCKLIFKREQGDYVLDSYMDCEGSGVWFQDGCEDPIFAYVEAQIGDMTGYSWDRLGYAAFRWPAYFFDEVEIYHVLFRGKRPVALYWVVDAQGD